MEPWEVDEALLDAIGIPKVCRHLHIPLQSGDDAILARMNRPYTAAEYLALIHRSPRADPRHRHHDGCDRRLPRRDRRGVREHLQADRAGRVLPAARVSILPPQAHRRPRRCRTRSDERVKKLRAEKLTEMGRTAMRRFAESFVGETLDVLVEVRRRRLSI